MQATPPQTTRLCPNSFCFNPFSALDSLQEIQSHFHSSTICGITLQFSDECQQAPCPNSNCSQTFPTLDIWLRHWHHSSNECHCWVYAEDHCYYSKRDNLVTDNYMEADMEDSEDGSNFEDSASDDTGNLKHILILNGSYLSTEDVLEPDEEVMLIGAFNTLLAYQNKPLDEEL